MSQPVLLKVYGNLHPATHHLLNLLRPLEKECLPCPEAGPVFDLDADLLHISFEGLYFPLAAVLDTIEASLDQTQQGKLDFLDLENWTLARYVFKSGHITLKTSPLNNVLDYSGH